MCSSDLVRAQVEETIGQGQTAPSGHIPFTPRAKKVLELSLREALQLGHNYIGTEHILLGLIREGEGVAAKVLEKLGADLNRVRQQVIQLLSGYQGKEPAQQQSEGTPSTSLVLDQFGRNLTQAAREMKLDRAEVRRCNLIPANKMPYLKPLKARSGMAMQYDSGDYPACQDEVLKTAGWDDFPQRQAQARRQGRYLGIGLAHGVKGSGRGPFESGLVRVSRTGRVTVFTGASAMGQGLGTAQLPSNQILTSLALFLSALVMWPVWTAAYREGVEPYQQGRIELAAAYDRKAAGLKDRLQTLLWDPAREFYFPMSMREEKDKEGNVVGKHTLTYQSGRFAGSPHGREEHGYVPWQFRLPDPGREAAWKFLMDPAFFHAEYGPATVERHDPLFLLEKGCCWWSGRAWDAQCGQWPSRHVSGMQRSTLLSRPAKGDRSASPSTVASPRQS